jgi:riboflavin biosynthesis pyrimidine reductase
MIKHILFWCIASVAAISSRPDKERVDKLHTESDAVVGGRTPLHEDPKLTIK